MYLCTYPKLLVKYTCNNHGLLECVRPSFEIGNDMISRKILKSLSDPSISLDPSNIRGQAYDGASVMSSGKEGVQAKIKEISPLAPFTHFYAHCLNVSIAALCKLSEV